MTIKDIYEFHTWFTNTFQPLEKRFSTMYQSLLLAVARNVKTIVETGTSRTPGNWVGDGQSTQVFAAFAERYDCKVWTCDIDPAAIEVARSVTSQYAGRVEYVVSDSVAFLR